MITTIICMLSGLFGYVVGLRVAKPKPCLHRYYKETRACDAICEGCGLNLGFIATVREFNSSGELPTEGY